MISGYDGCGVTVTIEMGITHMRSSTKRWAAVIGIVAGGGILLGSPGASCTSFFGKTALQAADLCFIFDCQNGLLGGTIDPCSGTGSGDATFEAANAPPLFTDCTQN